MKQLKMFFGILAVLLVPALSFANTNSDIVIKYGDPIKKATAKETTKKVTPVKAEKKFATVTYYFDPSKDYTNDADLINAANWSTTPFSACGSVSLVRVCSISFDSGTSPGSGYVTVGGTLDFSNSTLVTSVKAFRSYAGTNNVTDPASSITYAYRH